MKTITCINLGRINAIGGLGDAKVQATLQAFIDNRAVWLKRVRELLDKRMTRDLSEMLCQLDGTARTCGFDMLADQISAWRRSFDEADAEVNERHFERLVQSADSTAMEWEDSRQPVQHH